MLSPPTTGLDLSTPPQAFLVSAPAGRFKVLLAGDQEPSASITKLGGTVMQFASDGVQDPAFQARSFGLPGSFSVHIVAADESGEIYAAGDHDAGTGTEAALVRLLPSGGRDTGFGSQGYLHWSGALITALQSSGARIVVSVNDGASAKLYAVTALGVADATFGGGGTVALDELIGQAGCQLLTLHVSSAPSGGIWVGGTTCLTTTPKGVLLRLSDSGSLDAGFSGDGRNAINVLPPHVKALMRSNAVSIIVYKDVFQDFASKNLTPSSTALDQAAFSKYSPFPPSVTIYEKNKNGTANDVTFNTRHELGHHYQHWQAPMNLANHAPYKALVARDLEYMDIRTPGNAYRTTYAYFLTDYVSSPTQGRSGYEDLFAVQFALAPNLPGTSLPTNIRPFDPISRDNFMCSQAYVTAHRERGI